MNGAAKKYEHTEEELEAVREELLKKYGGFPPLEALGYSIVIILYERNKKRGNDETFAYMDPKTGQKIESRIVKSDEDGRDDKWSECVGQVVDIGPEAYKTGIFADGKMPPRCKLGDWVLVARHDGFLVDYRGWPTMQISDDRIGSRTPDPEYVSRYK